MEGKGKGKIGEELSRWEKDYPKDQEHRADFRTAFGFPVKPLYTSLDMGNDYLKDLGFPGDLPFTRGVYPTMYRGRLWTMRQLAGYGIAGDTNERFRYLLDQGASGINVVFDYPTLRGYDSDHPMARGDLGQGGVCIDTLDDMEELFEGIPVDGVSVSIVACNPIAAVTIMAMYFKMAAGRNIPWDRLLGTTQNDFLMETTITAAPSVLSPHNSFRLANDLIEFCCNHVPRWNPVSFTGYNYREAGTNAVQEVAMVIANALATTEDMCSRGYAPDRFVPRLSFFLSAHNDFFEEIAKFRAARRVWCRLVKERYNPKNPRTLAFRYHVQTAGCTLTAQEPLNNIARAACQAMAAVLGGAQSIHVDGYDEALSIPSETAALIALRTQQIIQSETNVTHTIDPLGGSYFLEHLTNRMEEGILDYIKQIEDKGGIVRTAETGWLHSEILKSSYQYQRDVENRQTKVVGVNCYQKKSKEEVDLFQAPDISAKQQARLTAVKKRRDVEKVAGSLKRLRDACRNGSNVVPDVIDAVSNYATLGEITRLFFEEFGSWNTPLSTL